MAEETDALQGLISNMRDFVREAVEKDYPASAVTLDALRRTKPQLAKQIFAEAVVASAKTALAKYPHEDAPRVLEEINSRFLQDPIAVLYYEVDLLVASRLIWTMFETHAPGIERFLFERARDENGKITRAGLWLANKISEYDLPDMLGRLSSARERRVQLLLAAVVAGEEALHEAVKKFTGYKRGSVLTAIASWLSTCKLTDAEHIAIMKQFEEKVCDELLEWLYFKYGGTSFLKPARLRIIFAEMFEGEEHIEF